MMSRVKTWVKVVVLLCVPLLLGIECFGVREFLGDPEEISPTEPCMELIPEPSPIALTPVVTPPEPEPEAEGTPIISDGEVVPVITVIPPPPPFGGYTVTIGTYISSSCSGSSISPSTGTIEAEAGDTITFYISVVMMTGCGYYIDVDSVRVDSNSMFFGQYFYPLTVTGDHDVYICIGTMFQC